MEYDIVHGSRKARKKIAAELRALHNDIRHNMFPELNKAEHLKLYLMLSKLIREAHTKETNGDTWLIKWTFESLLKRANQIMYDCNAPTHAITGDDGYSYCGMEDARGEQRDEAIQWAVAAFYEAYMYLAHRPEDHGPQVIGYDIAGPVLG